MFTIHLFILLLLSAWLSSAKVNYSGHKVLRLEMETDEHLQFGKIMEKEFSAEFWTPSSQIGEPAVVHLKPNYVKAAEEALNANGMKYRTVFHDLEMAIQAEQLSNSPTVNGQGNGEFNFSIYNRYEKVIDLLERLAENYPKIVKLEIVGKSYENRPIYSLKIGGDEKKPAIQMDFGIHSREWAAVAAGAYFVNKLITTYGSDPEVTKLIDQYEFDIIVVANPDGYVYTWKTDRLWRKTRSRNSGDSLGICRGVDANRNFDVDHCGVGTSNDPCDQMFCGEKPFSEGESRAIRDLLLSLGKRCKAFFSLHTYSQLWLTPYGNTDELPPNYDELVRIGNAGMEALAKRYGTKYRLGPIASTIYEAAGSTIDYAYKKHNVSISYTLEMRDAGEYGFLLPQDQVLPNSEEAFDGLVGAIKAI